MRIAILGFLLVSTACATNAFSSYYTDISSQTGALAAAPSSAPRIERTNSDGERQVEEYWERGYIMVGYSSYNGSNFAEKDALAQATSVGAEIVAINTAHTGTKSGAIPITSNQVVTTQTNTTGSAYGSAGYATVNTSGTSTTNIPTTTYIPYSVERYDVLAQFFAPMNPPCVGILTDFLSDAERKSVGTNQAFKIRAVRRGSPAFLANFFADDVLVNLNGLPASEEAFASLSSNQSVVATVIRDGRPVDLSFVTGACD